MRKLEGELARAIALGKYNSFLLIEHKLGIYYRWVAKTFGQKVES